jgi:hypothetical protein
MGLKGTIDIEYSLSGVSSSGNDGGKNQTYEVGYWNEFTSMLIDDSAWYSNGRQLMDINPGAKILYTPPEISPATVISPPVPYDDGSGGGFGSGNNIMMVSKGVSDEKLAVILNIFDTCAFDRETRVLATYGFEGENFEWAGEPFNSFVKELEDSPTFNNGNHLLSPPIWGGPAYNEVYDYNVDPNNPVYIHSRSDEGRARMLMPYKEDMDGISANDIAEWEAEHYTDIRKITADYFYAVVQGDKDIDGTWDEYIDELNSNGLSDYVAIMENWELVE